MRLTFSDEVPPRGVERIVRAPFDVRAVCLARVVLERVGRAVLGLAVKFWEGGHVRVPTAGAISSAQADCQIMDSRVRVDDAECLQKSVVGTSSSEEVRSTYCRVDLVDTETGVQVCQRCQGWCDLAEWMVNKRRSFEKRRSSPIRPSEQCSHWRQWRC